ncbi:hypothetical protein DSOUD_0636 [Desulfuromonas soudanensis]|uniref:Uncharacterized protein n=1 Tax=Desulfuromonas soudanensis TaxID=1603606 RepID=A0A0M5IKG4_9BACT|nr:hypothetical protein [Desulfuromonas soudanensis]ALC15424.1 hypothetical protein DSOUD_0636 [Desulfuromonas soudanensis]
MKAFKIFLVGLILGLAVGLWFGVNLGRDEPLLSNPFSEKSLQKQLQKTGGEMLEKSGQALEESGKALKEKFSE